MSETSQAETGATVSPGGWATVTQIVTAVGAGVGVLGFVTAFGGGIVWARAKALDLPANEIVSVVPKDVLITTGAAFLVPAVALAIAVAAALWMLDQGIAWQGRRAAERIENEAASLEAQALAADDEADRLEEEGRRIRAAMSSDPAANDDFFREAELRLARARAAREDAEHRRYAAENTTELAAAARTRLANLTRAQRVTRGLIGGLILVAFQIGAALLVANGIHADQILGLIAMAIFTAAITVVLYQQTDRTAWFILGAFISTGLFIGLLTYDRTISRPKVEPAAVVRTDDGTVVAGFYIARTADHTYIATIPEQLHPSRMLVLPSAKVETVAVGQLLSPDIAAARAIAIANQMCAERDATARLAAAKKPPQQCRVVD